MIGVVGLLSAIILPNLGKLLDGAKIARAKEDCETIAQAMERFYRDVGVWPTFGSTGMPGSINSFVTSSSVVTTSPYGFASAGSYLLLWLTGGTSSLANNTDILSNHLFTNTPKGQSTYTYPSSSLSGYYWRGPYLPPTMTDPWGHPYIVNILAPTAQRIDDANGTIYSYTCWVVSTGPNGTMNSGWQPTCTTDSPRRNAMQGDDIGVRIDLEID